jgi:nucleoside-diphosphate-sugar epimerase
LSSILITGGLGFVGRNLLKKIPAQPYDKIFCLCRSEPADRDHITADERVEFMPGSLPLGLEKYEQRISGADTLVHLAAITGKSRPNQYFQVNVEGTRALTDMCRRVGISKFLFVSSIAAGFPDKKNYYYGQSKEQAEDIVRASGLRYTILRPTIVLGPGAQVWQGLRRLARFSVIPIFGDGQTMIQPIWVDDLTSFIIDLLKANRFQNEILEVGGPESISIEEFLVRASRLLRTSEPRTFHLPLEPFRKALSWLEPLLLPILPLTAGQLVSFGFDGTPHPNALIANRPAEPPFRTIDQMLSALCAHDES